MARLWQRTFCRHASCCPSSAPLRMCTCLPPATWFSGLCRACAGRIRETRTWGDEAHASEVVRACTEGGTTHECHVRMRRGGHHGGVHARGARGIRSLMHAWCSREITRALHSKSARIHFWHATTKRFKAVEFSTWGPRTPGRAVISSQGSLKT